jgi:hypothetical protein
MHERNKRYAGFIELHYPHWKFTCTCQGSMCVRVESEQFLQLLYGFAVLRICSRGLLISTWSTIGTNITGTHSQEPLFLSLVISSLCLLTILRSFYSCVLVYPLTRCCVWMRVLPPLSFALALLRKIENLEVRSSLESEPLTSLEALGRKSRSQITSWRRLIFGGFSVLVRAILHAKSLRSEFF